MTTLELTAVFQESDGWIVGWIEELPGAISQERTIEEARESLKEAVQLVIEGNRELAQRQSTGQKVTRESLAVDIA